MEKPKRMPLCVHPFLIGRGGIDSKHETANTPFYPRLVVHMLMTDAGKESVFKKGLSEIYRKLLKLILLRT
jgi:hypothetical protein